MMLLLHQIEDRYVNTLMVITHLARALFDSRNDAVKGGLRRGGEGEEQGRAGVAIEHVQSKKEARG